MGKVIGYRELSESEIALMNEGKELGIKIGEFIEKLEQDASTDKRWLSIGTTDMQKGQMAVIRSIAKPETF